MEILLILMCIPLYVINSFCDKYISTQNSKSVNTIYNIFKFGLGSLILIAGFIIDKSKFGVGVVVCGIICGIMYAISKIIILAGYEKSSIAFMTMCHSSGMILPCMVGHFFWNEKLTALAIFGIVLVIVSILLLKESKQMEKNTSKCLWIGIIVLITSGGVMILQKLIGRYFGGVNAFNFYSFISAFLILSCINKGKKSEQTDIKKLVLCALLSAISLCVISIVMTKVSSEVPSVIMFPLFNGIGVIAVTLLSALLFKEKLTVKKISGIIIGLLGLFIINL